MSNLRREWLTLISAYGRIADSRTTARLQGAARIASAAHTLGTDAWYATAITVFWA